MTDSTRSNTAAGLRADWLISTSELPAVMPGPTAALLGAVWGAHLSAVPLITFVIGPSGSGKTTVSRVALAYAPTVVVRIGPLHTSSGLDAAVLRRGATPALIEGVSPAFSATTLSALVRSLHAGDSLMPVDPDGPEPIDTPDPATGPVLVVTEPGVLDDATLNRGAIVRLTGELSAGLSVGAPLTSSQDARRRLGGALRASGTAPSRGAVRDAVTAVLGHDRLRSMTTRASYGLESYARGIEAMLMYLTELAAIEPAEATEFRRWAYQGILLAHAPHATDDAAA